MSLNQDQLLEIIEKRYSTDNKGDFFHVGTALTMGVVVDNDDPLQMGRLRVFCPSLSHDPSKISQLPWCVYVTPYGGVINNTQYERGDGHTTTGAVAYGQFAIPELGANVLVGCIDGDLRRPFWIGCVYDQQETHTLATGRYNWSNGGKADGPLSSAGSPIEPQYSNAQKAFGGKSSSPEWQSREAEYTGAAVDKNVSENPTPDKTTYLDQQHDDISSAQQFAFNKGIVGSHGYDWSGFGGLPVKSPRVTSWSSPGFASMVMDDRLFNNRTRWKSSTGHMILLDDTNERIYIRTNTGNAWIEMDSAGNIDGYSTRRISLSADMDINLFSKQTVRIQGVEGVYINAGGANTFEQLSEAPPSGQIRFQATDDIHMVTSKTYRHLSVEDSLFEIGGNQCLTVGGTSKTQVQGEIDVITNAGNYNLTVTGDLNLLVTGSINILGITSATFASKGNVEIYSYFGSLNMGSQQDMNFKSVSGGLTMQAIGGNSAGTGGIVIKTPNSQLVLSDQGGAISTNGPLAISSGGDMNVASNSPSPQTQPFPDESQVPAITCDSLPPTVPITGFSGADLAARVAWNAGFRGQALTIAVAIAGAESSFNPTAIGDVDLETDKWGPSLGFWQVRTLKNPSAYNYPDTLRQNPQLYDPQLNANAAYAFSGSGKSFGAWSTYTSGSYLNSGNMNPAVTAITNMCNGTTMMLNNREFAVANITERQDDLLVGSCAGGSAITIGAGGISLQSLVDINVNALGAVGFGVNGQFSAPLVSGVISQVNLLSTELNTLAYYSSLMMTAIASALNALSGGGTIPHFNLNFPVDINSIIAAFAAGGITLPTSFTALINMLTSGLCLQLPTIPAVQMPYFSGSAQAIFQDENFNLNGGTIIL